MILMLQWAAEGQLTCYQVAKHPNADSLYVEDIDIGEAQPRQVLVVSVSNLFLRRFNFLPSALG